MNRRAMEFIVAEKVQAFNRALQTTPNPITAGEIHRILREDLDSRIYARRLREEAGFDIGSGHPDEYRVF